MFKKIRELLFGKPIKKEDITSIWIHAGPGTWVNLWTKGDDPERVVTVK